jgi:Rrf2 family protein
MLKLTKKADYGLIALRHLAMTEASAENGAPTSASAKAISDEYRIPLPLLSKVLQRLAKGGFLESLQGTNGGYRLARSSGEISVLEVIHTIDGPVILTSCFHGESECEQTSTCTVREPLRKVHEAIKSLLSGITIADICSGEISPAANAGRAKQSIIGLEELVRN